MIKISWSGAYSSFFGGGGWGIYPNEAGCVEVGKFGGADFVGG